MPLSQIAADSEVAANLSRFRHALFALLEKNSISYCVLNVLPEKSDGATEILELAVHREHRQRIACLFLDLPRESYKPVQRISAGTGFDHYHFALLDGAQIRFAHVLMVCPQPDASLFALEGSMFDRRRWQSNCHVAARSDQFAYLLARIAETGTINVLQGQSLKLLVDSLGKEEARTIARRLFGDSFEAEVVTACSTASLGQMLHKISVSRTVSVGFRAGIRNRWQLLRNWFRPSGLVVTILGPDGAGKTTISNKVFEALRPVFGSQKLLLWRPEVLPRLSPSSSPDDLPHSKPLRGALSSIARLCAVFLDYWVGHFVLIKPLLSRAALVLYDRDLHDILVDSRRYRYGGPRWLPSLLTKALPRTESLLLVLEANPEIILARKQEVSPREVRRQIVEYRRLADKLPDAYLVPTDGDAEVTTSLVAKSVADYLNRRYRNRHARSHTNGFPPRPVENSKTWMSTIRRIAADLYLQQRGLMRKGSLAVLDQAFISGSNFLLSILLARWLRADQYGAYALSFAIFVLLSFLQQGLFLEPMSVFGPSIYRNAQRQYLGTLLWLQAAVAGIFIIVAAIAATTYLRDDSGLLQKALLGMFIGAPCVLLYWFARRAFYLQLQPGRAVGGAILYCVVLSATIWLLVRTGLLSAFTAFVAMGLAALITSMGQLCQLRPIFLTRKSLSDLREVTHRHWRYGRWAILGSLFIWIPWNIYYPVVGRFSGLAEVANLRALLNLVLPVTQTLSAFTLLFLPHASHVSDQENWSGAKALALKITAFFAFGTLLYWLPVCLFRAPLLQFLYAGRYSAVAQLVPWVALSSVLSGVALGPTIALRAKRSPETVSLIYAVSSGVTLMLGIPATHFFGIAGAVTFNLVSNVAAVILAWVMLYRLARQKVGANLVAQEVLP